MPSQDPAPAPSSSSISPLTLAIASASSVVAAIVVSKVWGPGTLIGAAVTPVIVTLVTEALKKPAEKITVVRISATGTQVHERDAPAVPVVPGELAPRTVHRSRRRPIALALLTGLVAFAIAAVVLTSTELLLGDSSVGSSGKRTTILGGQRTDRTTETTPEEEPATRTQEDPGAAPAPTEPGTTPAPGPTGPAERPEGTPEPTPPAGTAPPSTPAPAPATPPPAAGPTTP